MARIAVVAHKKKTLGGGLDEPRDELAERGVIDPLWIEVKKSKFAPKAIRKALMKGAELVLVWGGDGSVQRAVDSLAGTSVPLGVLPAVRETSSPRTWASPRACPRR